MALQMTSFVMILPLFARRVSEFGAGVDALGESAMAYALTSTLAAPFMGALADRFGRRPLVLGALAVYILAFTGYLFASSAPVFILLRGLAGAFTAGLIPAVTGIVSDLAPTQQRAQWIGIVSAGGSFGWIAGPLLGGVLYDHWGSAVPFVVAIIMAALTFVLALLAIPETRKEAPRAAEKAGPASLPRLWQNLASSLHISRETLPASLPNFIVLLSVCFAVMFAWAFIEPRFMFYAYEDLGWSSSMLGLVMSTYGVAMTLGELGLSRLSDRFGRKPVIVVGLALFAAQFMGLAFSRDYVFIAAAFVIAGLGNALFDPALSAYILDIAPAEHQVRILGIKSTAGSLGNILGPALVVLFTPFLPAQSIFLIAVGIVVLITLVSLFVRNGSQVPGTSLNPKMAEE
jgi:DHA1 family tetracycline resistance protein-like MFS transporter